MRKAQIRTAVSLHLAEIGYSRGLSSWPKAGRLCILQRGGKVLELHIPAVKMSRKRLAEILAIIPVRGPAIEWRREAKYSLPIQLDIEAYC